MAKTKAEIAEELALLKDKMAEIEKAEKDEEAKKKAAEEAIAAELEATKKLAAAKKDDFFFVMFDLLNSDPMSPSIFWREAKKAILGEAEARSK